MRRIYRTTTALVASIAILSPHLALAQEPQPGAAPEALVLPQADQPETPAEATGEDAAEAPEPPPAAELPAEEQVEQQAEDQPAQDQTAPDQPVPDEAQPAAAPQEEAEQPTEPAAETPQPVEAEADTAPPEPMAEPSAEPEPATQPAAESAEKPTPKPELTQAEQPPEKPPIVQADTPEPKPEPAPEASAEAPMPDAAPEASPETAAEPATDTAVKAAPDTAADTADQAAGEAPKDGADMAGKDMPAKEPAQEPTPEAPPKPQDKAQADMDKPEAKPQPDSQPDTAAAPETGAEPDALARRAAEEVAPVSAAALSAGTDDTASGEVTQETITEDTARSSAEDFATAIAQGLQAQQEAPAETAKRDDDDDTARDIAKMLLAGAAGLAVGKMLSNDRQVALNTGDRVVVTLPDGSQQVIKDENALLYRPGSNVQTETFEDGSSRNTVLREDGSRVVTIRDADMNILRRTLVRADGSETQLIDDTRAEPVRISDLPPADMARPVRGPMGEDALRAALQREAAIDRRFSLGQIRHIAQVRALVAPVNVPEITFDSGSAAISPDQAQQLAGLGKVIRDSIASNPAEIYLIEGYTDAIGSDAANLALSDRRAESVALALTEYFQVPPENMVVQGYGEQFLLIRTLTAERDNRRVAVRRITDLLARQN